jgi:dipeptidyl aminopeptidase/acylaminoacyl peptidase
MRAGSLLSLAAALWSATPQFIAAQVSTAQAAAPAAPGGSAAAFTLDDVLDVKNVSLGAVSEDGRWAVITTASLRDRLGTDNYRYGDPTYIGPGVAQVAIVDTRTGESRNLFPDKRQARGFVWSPDASRLAFLLSEGDWVRPVIWERANGRIRNIPLPAGHVISQNANLEWTPDGAKLLLALRTTEWMNSAKQRFDQEVNGPIVVQSSSDPFLSWDEIRNLGFEQSIALYDVASGRVAEVQPSSRLRSYGLAGNGVMLRLEEDITEKTNYEEIRGGEGKLLVRPLAGGEARVLFPTTRGVSVQWSGDGRSYAYSRDNRIWFARVDGGEPRRLTGTDEPRRDSAAAPRRAPGAPEDSAARADRERRERERFTPVRLSHDGAWLVASNREGLWLIDTASGARERFHETAEEDSTRAPRWSVIEWSRDGKDIYLSYAARTAWERGIYRYDRSTKQLRELTKDARMYSGIQLSADGRTMVLSIAEGNRPGDIYVADSDLTNVRRLTEANPGIAAKLGRTELIEYLDVDGNELYGVLYYPVDYRPNTRYPTVFIVYESFFDDRFNSTIAYLTSNGYAVMQPSVNLERGYPGEAWMKGVTSAANKLIEMGIADKDRLGVHGTSYGGYAVNLLVTQTNRFAAAINISGKVDMISFYTDSPRLGTRNIHAPERSQDRIGATLWEQPQKYIAHSAIMSADRIRTPLLLLTGKQDHNVPERTTMEMFYALRRLGREVEWVSYINGGHGMPTTTEAEVRDYHQRILGWYDKYLKKTAPTKTADNS